MISLKGYEMIGFTAQQEPKKEIPDRYQVIKILEEALRKSNASQASNPVPSYAPPSNKRYAVTTLYIDGSKAADPGTFDLKQAEITAANIMSVAVGKVAYVEIHEVTLTPKFRLTPTPVAKPYTVQSL